MAVPKRKTSRSNTRHRRSQWKAQPADLVPVVVDGIAHRVPRRLHRVPRRLHRVPRRLHRAVQRGLIDPPGR
jgi:large subunit ribosomal protein L32